MRRPHAILEDLTTKGERGRQRKTDKRPTKTNRDEQKRTRDRDIQTEGETDRQRDRQEELTKHKRAIRNGGAVGDLLKKTRATVACSDSEHTSLNAKKRYNYVTKEKIPAIY